MSIKPSRLYKGIIIRIRQRQRVIQRDVYKRAIRGMKIEEGLLYTYTHTNTNSRAKICEYSLHVVTSYYIIPYMYSLHDELVQDFWTCENIQQSTETIYNPYVYTQTHETLDIYLQSVVVLCTLMFAQLSSN